MWTWDGGNHLFVPTCAKEIAFLSLIICPQIPNYVKLTAWSLGMHWLISIHCHCWERLLTKLGNQKRSNVFPNFSTNSFLKRYWPKTDIKKEKSLFSAVKSHLCSPESHSSVCIAQLKIGKVAYAILHQATGLLRWLSWFVYLSPRDSCRTGVMLAFSGCLFQRGFFPEA